MAEMIPVTQLRTGTARTELNDLTDTIEDTRTKKERSP